MNGVFGIIKKLIISYERNSILQNVSRKSTHRSHVKNSPRNIIGQRKLIYKRSNICEKSKLTEALASSFVGNVYVDVCCAVPC